MSDEHVLCLPAHICSHIEDGFTAGDRLASRLSPEPARWLPRSECETDPKWQQLIPYCVLLHAGAKEFAGLGDCPWQGLFAYQRTKQQGESRLHGKWSIGVGGHISRELDGGPGEQPAELTAARVQQLVLRAAVREVHEEVELFSQPHGLQFRGLLRDRSDPVGEVHLGVVYTVQLPEPYLASREPSAAFGGLRPRGWFQSRIESFEKWSQILLGNSHESPAYVGT